MINNMESFEDDINTLKNLGFIHIKASTTEKRPFGKWKDKTKSDLIYPKKNRVGYLTGLISGVTVVDIDVKDNGLKYFKEFCKTNNIDYKTLYHYKTPSGGLHFPFKYDDRFNTKAKLYDVDGSIIGIDIRNDGGFCMCPPSLGYKWVLNPLMENDDYTLDSIPEKLAEFILTNNKKPKKKSSANVKKFTSVDSVETNISKEQLDSILSKLDESRFDEFESWRNIGFIINYYIGESGLDLFKKYSSTSDKYDEDENDDFYSKISLRVEKPLSIGTLFYYLKSDLSEVDYDNFKNEYDEKYGDHMINILYSPFDDTTVIKYFLKKYPNYKAYEGIIYHYNGNNWIKGSEQSIIYDIDNMYTELFAYAKNKFEGEELVAVLKKILKLRSIKNKKTIIEGIIGYVNQREDIFDLNSYLIGFNNGVFDLKTMEFRNTKIDDYISMSVGYDYRDPIEEDYKLGKAYFEKIMPVEEECEHFKLLLATSLLGVHLEKFIVCTGIGRNGKDSLFTYQMKNILGQYYYNCNSTALTQKIKGDQNVSIANFNKKRLVITSEPDKNDTVKTNMVKALTGSDEIAMRSLYSTNTKVNLHQTLFMMCNDKPALDNCDHAILKRLQVIPFRSVFESKTSMEENNIKEGENFIYEADENVKSKEYIENMKFPILHTLLKYYKTFQNNGYQILSTPKSINDLNQDYLQESDEFYCWFESCYEKSQNKDDFIKLGGVYNNFTCSEYYENLNKKEKRLNNKTKFLERIQKHITLRKFYKEKLQYKENGKYTTARNVLTGFSIKIDEDKNDEF